MVPWLLDCHHMGEALIVSVKDRCPGEITDRINSRFNQYQHIRFNKISKTFICHLELSRMECLQP